MDNWFRSKWFIRGLSLGFAILLYVFVSIEEADTANDSSIPFSVLFGGSSETKVIEDVPLGIRIDSEKYVVSGVPETVKITLEGPSSELTPTVEQQNFEMFVDLRDLKEGEHEVEIQYEGISDKLGVYVEPKTINVIIEERASNEFDVSVDFINEDKLPEGYEVSDYELNTDTVTITSSEEVIDRIAIVKVFVDLTGVTESIKNREIPVNVYDSQGNELGVIVEPATIVVSATIDNPSKKVPVSVATTGELPEGYTIKSMVPSVEEAEVFAITEILESLEEVKTEPIDLSELSESGTMKVGLALPERVQAPGVEEIEVEVVLEQTKSIDDVTIEVDNLGSGQSVSFIEPDDPQISISVTGNEQDVKELSAEDFRVFVDADGLDTGEHTVPITIEGPENVTYSANIKEVTIEIEES
ncbi:CdaR family protein [Ornithinibacillus xuwenensis]|uniref:CdaR family protein n=1 Tax=Ornithinibacillus xuwenensis TaxID=3144668 RepID=A0ABU9XKS5_9BACI